MSESDHEGLIQAAQDAEATFVTDDPVAAEEARRRGVRVMTSEEFFEWVLSQ